MSTIFVNVRLRGKRHSCVSRALVDTGAEISLLPMRIAKKIGAWRTNQYTTVVGVHNQEKTLPLVVCRISFPSLDNRGGRVPFVMGEEDQEPIIGMDILRPMGISIDTSSGNLSIKNEIWEAFKKIAGVGVLVYGGVTLLDALSGSKK